MADIDEDELLADLGLEIAPPKMGSRTPREERVKAGFEDILRFHQTYGRAPLHGEGWDIFERLYAVRLDQLRQLPEAHALLAGLDGPGLLSGAMLSDVGLVRSHNEDSVSFVVPPERGGTGGIGKSYGAAAAGRSGEGLEINSAGMVFGRSSLPGRVA